MDQLAEVVVPLGGIVMIICVVVCPILIVGYFRNQDRQRLHETIRLLAEKGQPISPEMLSSLAASPDRPNRGSDMRRGVTMIAVAIAMVVLGVALYPLTEGSATGPLVGSAAFPGFIGIGLIVMAFIRRRNLDV